MTAARTRRRGRSVSRTRRTGHGRRPLRPRISILIEAPEWRRRVRNVTALARRAAAAALAADPPANMVELSLVLADDRMVHELNRRWRGHDKPTNVLSFPAEDQATRPPRLPDNVRRPLGDVVIASGVATAEARTQGKSVGAHLAHLVVHGVLHLLGHDHERDADADRMEAMEVSILRRLGIADPYRGAR